MDSQVTKLFRNIRIEFRLRHLKEITFDTKTNYKHYVATDYIYSTIILQVKLIKTCNSKTNQLTEIAIFGGSYIRNSLQKNYFVK